MTGSQDRCTYAEHREAVMNIEVRGLWVVVGILWVAAMIEMSRNSQFVTLCCMGGSIFVAVIAAVLTISDKINQLENRNDRCNR